ncbi:Beta-lactamase class A [Actinoplanes regularis]|uniref:Beta-lactamase class A n=2 Tax=Actinoplanes regularis TaxID=52697 RepID=A0A239D6A4_9ACTN|nr:Beta-lactamase class A [Actinoplanes regularis]
MMAAVIVLGGAGLLAKGVIGGEGAAATFLTGDPSAVTASPSPTGPSPEELARIARAKKVKALDAALKKYAATVPEFSVAVLDKKTGESYAYRGDEHYETASVVKVQVLACLLLTAQDGGRKLTSLEDTRAGKMIRLSDNQSTTELFKSLGGRSGIQKCDKRMGLTGTTVNNAWGLTRTTVSDQVKLLSQLVSDDSPLSEKARDYAHKLMSTVDSQQRWGVPAAARTGEEFTVKNGWLPRSTENNLWIVNSVGRITGDDVDVSIAVLSHGHKTQQAGEAVIEKVVKTTRNLLRY